MNPQASSVKNITITINTATMDGNQDAKKLHAPVQKAKIDEFLCNLSGWDRLYLRDRLRREPIIFSGLQHLPNELVCNITDYLERTDFAACIRVSKTWARILTHDLVISRLARRLVPGLTETYPSTPIPLLLCNEFTERRKWKQPFFRQTNILWQYPFSEYFKQDSSREEQATIEDARARGPSFLSHPVFYANRKLAWEPRPGSVLIDDLSKKTRSVIYLPHGPLSGRTSVLKGLSDSLIVVNDVLSAGQPTSKVYVAPDSTVDVI